MKRIIAILIFMLCFSVTVGAQTEEDVLYSTQYETSGADDLQYSLPEDTRKWLSENGLDPKDYDWVNKLTAKSVFGHIGDLLSGGIKKPLQTGAAVLGIILVCAAFPALSQETSVFETAKYAATLSVALTVALPVWNSVTAAVKAVKGCGTFMLSFVPVFAATVSVSGGAVTAVSMSALLLAAAEVVVFIAGFAVLPLMGAYLAISLCNSVSPLVSSAGIAEGIKKLSFWVFSLVTTVFMGILSIQTVVNSAADSLTLKTTRFILGTSVPVAGAALSEAVSTVSACVGLLKSSVGIYGIVALAAILLPILAELVLWRVMLAVTAAVAEIFSQAAAGKILKAVDMMLSMLVGVILLTAALFIISLSVVVTVGKSA